jgi:hypothetical protein
VSIDSVLEQKGLVLVFGGDVSFGFWETGRVGVEDWSRFFGFWEKEEKKK